MHSLRSLLLVLGGVQAVAAQSPFSYCGDQTICTGDTPQCTRSGEQWMCCAAGQKVINGTCVDGSSMLCADGETICSGDKPQCTTSSGVQYQGSSVCCAVGEQAFSGKCYSGALKLEACYDDGPCDIEQWQYCAWTTNGGYSRCCPRDHYVNNGYDCEKKP